ncbi:uncharacterized protein LOC111911086 [Lactuca sativa]|uniref:DUF4228 domain-containing protein n=1 Tax=Lactuca sativa TaxID=4236 RepID=A0A9R1WY05_LACSA|nr:uncharacterized protein LOC111911086 [Lactuca sativa]KAJ0191961.1 hypothetical protein LSAT_V11C800452400 [Lactuca sativa]
MGNCQAVDAAALVIQHPSGKIERMYWSVTASEIMKMNPGHYVSIIIPLPPVPKDGDDDHHQEDDKKTIRFTRVKLLRPTDTLVLGRAYRLVTTHEVMKVVRAKRHAKLKNKTNTNPPESMADNQSSTAADDHTVTNQVEVGHERMFRQRSGSSSSIFASSRSKSWRPSLKSISEAAS